MLSLSAASLKKKASAIAERNGMIFLFLLCLFAFICGVIRELIFINKDRNTSLLRCLFTSSSLWKSTVFFGVGTIAIVTILFWDVFTVLNLTHFRFLCSCGVMLLLFAVSILFGIGHRSSKWGVMAVFFILLTILAECICNFRTFQSVEYEKVNLLQYMTYSSGMVDRIYPDKFPESVEEDPDLPNLPGTYTFSGSMAMEFTDLNIELHNLWLEVRVPEGADGGDVVTATLRLTDEGNQEYYNPRRNTFDINSKDKSTQWISLDTAGVSEKLVISLDNEECEVEIIGIWANAPKPARISILRMLIVFLLSFAIYAARPGSPLYEKKLSGSSSQLITTMVIVVANIILSFLVIACGNFFLIKGGYSYQHKQYQELAERLAEGEVSLKDEVPQFLLDMENPYDKTARDEAAKEAGQTYRWDSAYYNGKYYVYFGITPVILMYLPFYLITGDSGLPNDVVVFVATAFFIVGAFLLVYKFMKKKYPEAPYLLYLLISLLVANCSGIFNLLIYPSLYTVPIAVGLALTVWGLALWLSALEKPNLSGWRLLLGSLCMALVAGCRPQMLLWSFLAIPLFYKAVVKEKTLLPTSKSGIKNLICFAVPYIVVAAGLMYYNAIRFGSPFDFGANYNLTTNDMTVRGFRMGRIGDAVFAYLIQLPKYISVYPFIRSADGDSSYVGTVIRETVYGGLLFATPFTWFGMAAFGFRKWLREHRLFGTTVFLLLCGLIVMIMDAQMAGILQRYFTDFALFFVSAAVIVFITVYQRVGELSKKWLITFLLFALIAASFYNATLVFSSYYLTMPEWLRTALQFWM